MKTENYAANPATLPEGTLSDLFLQAVDRFGNRPALRHSVGGRWEDLSYTETLRRVMLAASGLRTLGLGRGDPAAILSANRPEWAVADYACLCTGVTGVPIYPSLTARQIGYILRNSGSRLAFVSDAEQLAKVEAVRAECPALEWVVVFDAPEGIPDRVVAWKDFLAGDGRGGDGPSEAPDLDEAAFRTYALSARPEDTATILYTSGTTGDPKGVMLSHNNLHSNVLAARQTISVGERDSALSFLPLSHVFQRMVDYLFFREGVTISYARSIDTVPEDLRAVRPTVVVSVPRLYEKVHARVTAATGLKGTLVQWACRVGEKVVDARLSRRRPDPFTAIRYRLADRLVFSKIRAGVGGRLRFFVSGGAPLAPEVNRFFLSAGILILEGYGLTETSPVTNVNSDKDFPANFRIGSVGKPVPGTEVRIAGDGEILIRGPQVMKGYFQDPAATAEVITEDGWFHTGDIGELDPDGFLRITDRKKDIIVTAGGKNVAPQPIENRLKAIRSVEQAVLIGDRRPFIVLLLVPDMGVLESWARESGLSTSDRRELLSDAGVQKVLEGELRSAFEEFSRVERPKRVLLVEDEFTVESGALTPTQKVKRRVVEERYRAEIDAMYGDGGEERFFFTSW